MRPQTPATPGPRAPDGTPARPRLRWWPLYVAALVTIVLLQFVGNAADTGDEVAYARLLRMVDREQVDQVTLHTASGLIEATKQDGTKITAQGPPGGIPDADLERLSERGVARTYAPEPSNWLGSIVVYFLPVLFLIGAIVWMSRRAGGQLGGATAFAKSRARLQDPSAPTTTFADVAGYGTAKEEISEVVGFLKEPDRYRAVGARIPKGLLLVGPPGTGKTLFARAVAGEAGVPFVSVNASEFLEMFVGIGAARVRDLFATARRHAPAIVFVDEIDAIGRKRGTGIGGGHDEREQTLNQLLAEMDGFEGTEGIVVLAATNRPDVLDPALLRAGRFDRQVVIPLPTQAERSDILAVHARSKAMSPDVDLDLVARETPGMSGAELANLLNEAALRAVRRGATTVTAADVEAARDRLLLGLSRPSLVLSPEEQRSVAYHEAGHAVTAHLLPGADPVHKVTILPSGIALGVTQQLPDRDRVLQRRSQLDDTLAVMLAGRAAEQLVFGEVSTGAHDDLVGATELARRMVREWGMSGELGEMAWASNEAVFLGEHLVQTRDYSDDTASTIDDATGALLEQQSARARDVLTDHRSALDAVAEALLHEETLSGDRVAALVAEADRPAGVLRMH